MHVLSIGFLKLFHTVSFDLCWPLKHCTASLVTSRRFGIVGGDLFILICLIPWYARACVSAESLVPQKLNLAWTSRSRLSRIALFVPSLANLSLSLLPRSPLWSFTHLNWVVADLRLRRNAALWKSAAFVRLSNRCIPCLVGGLLARQ